MTGEIKKEINAVTDSTTAEVTDKELELINAYSRRKLTKDEVYVFGVVLCDNDIDRDNERFTVESLFELEKLFVGKTGILTTRLPPKSDGKNFCLLGRKRWRQKNGNG